MIRGVTSARVALAAGVVALVIAAAACGSTTAPSTTTSSTTPPGATSPTTGPTSTTTSSDVASLAAGVAREELVVNGGTSALLASFRVLPSVATVTAALPKLETDLSKEEADTRAKSAYVCIDASNVETDTVPFVAPEAAVTAWLAQVPADAQDLRQGLGYLQAAWANLVAAHGTGTSANGSNPADERAALQAGQHALSLMDTTVLSQVRQIDAAVKEVQSASNTATELCSANVSG